ncbi:MAG: ABC transporter ATP-binding protein [Burkholderiales bacterium]|nr:ABC transporter ATP-binding protein [Nitrosomonas sp.]MCP5274538.1 ABC transporter ATP-binding protein [Burkholderiales bacterium]
MKTGDHAIPHWKRIFQIFLPMLWVHRNKLIIAYFWGLIAVSAVLLAPWPLKYIIDNVLAGKPLPGWFDFVTAGMSPVSLVLALAVATALIAVIGALSSAAEKMRNARIREQLDREVRSKVLQHIQNQPASMFDQHKSGELVLRLVDDGDKVVRLLTKTTPVIFRHLATTFLAFVAMVLVSPLLGLLGGIIVLGLAMLVRRYAEPLRLASRNKRKAEGDVSALAQEIIRGLANTQALGMEQKVSERFNDKTRISKHAGVEETRVVVDMERIMQLANGLAIALIIGGGGLLVLKGQLTLGSLTVCMAYIIQLLKPVEKINDLAFSVSRAMVRGENLVHLLDQHSKIQNNPNAVILNNPKGEIRFEQVSFTYPPNPDSHKDNCLVNDGQVLNNINFVLEPGKLTLLTGPSGSGKSTLLNLMLRMMDPTSGAIYFDGVPYPDIQLKNSLRRQFAVMLQRNYVFAGSLHEHFYIAGREPEDAQIWHALEMVAMTDFVKKLPQGLYTTLGEDAVNLSGGQRARLALARTFLMDRPVLLLDEPLANVDPESREIILDALDCIRAGRSCLVVTHQFEMADRADRIVVLRNGQLETYSGQLSVKASAVSSGIQTGIIRAAIGGNSK